MCKIIGRKKKTTVSIERHTHPYNAVIENIQSPYSLVSAVVLMRLSVMYSFILPPLIFYFLHSQPELQLLGVLYLVVVAQTFISEFFESSAILTLLAAVFLHPPSLSGMEVLGSTVPME